MLRPTQDFVGNAADQYALEQGETTAADDYQIGPDAPRDLFDGVERRGLRREDFDPRPVQTGTLELPFECS
jgi:hypothetical protein